MFSSMQTKRIQLIVLITGIIFYSFASVKGLPLEDDNTKASIEWVKKVHNFGKITKNEPVKAEFEFKNKVWYLWL